MLTNTIIKDIKPEQRIPIQEKLFAEGNEWIDSLKQIRDYNFEELYINKKSKISLDLDDEDGLGTGLITADEYLGEENKYWSKGLKEKEEELKKEWTDNIFLESFNELGKIVEENTKLRLKAIMMLELSKISETDRANQLIDVAINLIKKL